MKSTETGISLSDTATKYTIKCGNGKYHFSFLNDTKQYAPVKCLDLAKYQQAITLKDQNNQLYLGQFYQIKHAMNSFDTLCNDTMVIPKLFQKGKIVSSAVMQINSIGYLELKVRDITNYYAITIHPHQSIVYLDDLVYLKKQKDHGPIEMMRLYWDPLLELLREIDNLHSQGLMKLQLSPEEMCYDQKNNKFWIMDLSNSIYYAQEKIIFAETIRYIGAGSYRYISPEELLITSDQYEHKINIDYYRMDLQSYLIVLNLIIFEKTLFSYYFNQEMPIQYPQFCIQIWFRAYDYGQNCFNQEFKEKWSRTYNDFKDLPEMKPLIDSLTKVWDIPNFKVNTSKLYQKLKLIKIP